MLPEGENGFEFLLLILILSGYTLALQPFSHMPSPEIAISWTVCSSHMVPGLFFYREVCSYERKCCYLIERYE